MKPHTNFTEQKRSRKSVLKSMGAGLVAATAGLFGVAQAKPNKDRVIKRLPDQSSQDGVPLFSSTTTHNGLVYLAGIGYHSEGDISKHTTEVLNRMEEVLEEAGSSMERVLKVNVYLADLADYEGLNEAYQGRFGDNPPVRTTVATYGGVPGDSLVEMDCIAALNEE